MSALDPRLWLRFLHYDHLFVVIVNVSVSHLTSPRVEPKTLCTDSDALNHCFNHLA